MGGVGRDLPVSHPLGFQEVNGKLHVGDALGVLVGYLQSLVLGTELLLERHDQLHQVQ